LVGARVTLDQQRLSSWQTGAAHLLQRRSGVGGGGAAPSGPACRRSTSLHVRLRLKLFHHTPRGRFGGGGRYSSYSFLTSALDWGEWSASRPGRYLPPGKGPPVPIVQEAGWAPEPVWAQRLEEKSFRLCRGSNLHRPVVQSVARHYTD
jgi:hypothetical protein